MIGKFILIGLIVAGLYGYNNMGSQPNDPLVSVAPREKIEQKVDQEIDPNVSKVKDIVLKFLLVFHIKSHFFLRGKLTCNTR